MKFRRRKYLISSKLQMRFTVLFVLVAVIGNMAAVVLFNVLALKKLDAVLWSTHINIASTDELVGQLFININILNIFLVVVLLLITGGWILRKTAGPLIRMSKDINSVTEGDLSSPIILRQKDEFKDVADELNIMTGNLRDRFVNIKDKYEEVSRTVAMLEKGLGDKEVSITTCNSLLKNIEGLETEMNKFKLQ